MVDRCLAPLELRPAQLAGIIVGDGPGGFTGLRIGWAAAKGLAQAGSLTVMAIPSLLVLAASAAAVHGAVPIASWIDALRGEVFGALYVVHPDRVETVLTSGLATPDEIIARSPLRPRAVVADTSRHAALAESWTGAPLLLPTALRPSAASLIALKDRDGAGRVLEDLSTAEPEYGRAAEAQARWEARHGRPLPHPSRAGG